MALAKRNPAGTTSKQVK